MARLWSASPAEFHGRAAQWLVQSGVLLGDPHQAGAGNISLFTLSLIRWVAVIGQLFMIVFVHFSLGIRLPLASLLAVVGFSVVVNALLLRVRRSGTRLGPRRSLAVLSFDVVQLGVLLGLTGGLNNPFSVLLLLPVALASTTLTRSSTWILTAVTLVTIGVLVSLPGGLPLVEGSLRLPNLYLGGLALALSLAVLLVAWQMWQLAEDARRQESAFSAVQLALSREQQLSALGGQAAAVAHALGSPLGTINIIAKELVRELPENSPLAEDTRELLAQARRCRDVLSTLGRPEGEGGHEAFTAGPLSEHLRDIATACGEPGIDITIEVELEEDALEPVVSLPSEVRHALTNLVENAVSFARERVCLALEIGRMGTVLSIDDDGPGFAPEVLDRLGEPYNKGREDDGGLGLGIFIAQSLLARTGAKLHFESKNQGARVVIHWPAAAIDG